MHNDSYLSYLGHNRIFLIVFIGIITLTVIIVGYIVYDTVDSSDYLLVSNEIQTPYDYKKSFSRYVEARAEAKNDAYSDKGSTPSSADVASVFEVPDANTYWKGFMCIHSLDYEGSNQYRFIWSGEFKGFSTDSQGLMKYKSASGHDYYIVAMASYYTGNQIGRTFRITLESGVVFDVIVGDEKADEHTMADTVPPLHQYRCPSDNDPDKAELIEFIVACGASGQNCNNYNPTLSDGIWNMGSVDSFGFSGRVTKVERLKDDDVVTKLYGN